MEMAFTGHRVVRAASVSENHSSRRVSPGSNREHHIKCLEARIYAYVASWHSLNVLSRRARVAVPWQSHAAINNQVVMARGKRAWRDVKM